MVGSLQLHFAHMRNHRRDAAGWTTAVLERRIYSCPITLEAPSFLGNIRPGRRGDMCWSLNSSNRQLCFWACVRPRVAAGRKPERMRSDLSCDLGCVLLNAGQWRQQFLSALILKGQTESDSGELQSLVHTRRRVGQETFGFTSTPG